ncbi:MAG: DUF4326 domain-containing protein [Dongiaceae bacterium]
MRKPKPQAPFRVQLSRAKGWRMPPDTVKVDRTTFFGNPFSIDDFGHDHAVELHRRWLTGGRLTAAEIVAIDPHTTALQLKQRRKEVLARLPELRGKNLGCWCRLPAPGEPDLCHAALLLELANRPSGSG